MSPDQKGFSSLMEYLQVGRQEGGREGGRERWREGGREGGRDEKKQIDS